MPNTIKVSAEGWLDAARQALIEEGIAGVKIKRLAQQLGVTRGGFYYHFVSLDSLLAQLLLDWRNHNRFIEKEPSLDSPEEAAVYLDAIAKKLIFEDGFSASYDLAIRDWARTNSSVADNVDEVDKERIESLRQVFCALGCPPQEVKSRAEIFYYHQIGFYSLGLQLQLSPQERLKRAAIYLRILCGRRYQSALDQAE